MVRAWERYVRHRYNHGKSPESTAEHLLRFTRQRIVRPYPASTRNARDTRRTTTRSWTTEERSRMRAKVTPQLADRMIADDLRREAAELAERGEDLRAALLVEEAERLESSVRDAVRRASRRTSRDPQPRVASRLDDRPLCPRGTEMQTLIFPPGTSKREVRAWTKRHNRSARRIDVSPTTGSVRVRQRNPRAFVEDSFATILISPRRGVQAVIGCPLPGRENNRRRSRKTSRGRKVKP